MMNSSAQYHHMLGVTGIVPVKWKDYGTDLYHSKMPIYPIFYLLTGDYIITWMASGASDVGHVITLRHWFGSAEAPLKFRV